MRCNVFRDGGSSPVSTKTSRSLMVSRAPAIAGHFTGAAIRPKDTATYDEMQRETRLGDCFQLRAPPFPTFGFRIKSPHLLAVLS